MHVVLIGFVASIVIMTNFYLIRQEIRYFCVVIENECIWFIIAALEVGQNRVT